MIYQLKKVAGWGGEIWKDTSPETKACLTGKPQERVSRLRPSPAPTLPPSLNKTQKGQEVPGSFASRTQSLTSACLVPSAETGIAEYHRNGGRESLLCLGLCHSLSQLCLFLMTLGYTK